ncbi:hypothetical protein WOC76_04775 [Methylocystis sp. IM3]|uniref:hypothetical protein n=1 Tax=unclassified Methylocystis TaxID=2625913 RepID=UPI0030F83C58
MSDSLLHFAEDEQCGLFGSLEFQLACGPAHVAGVTFDLDPALPKCVFGIVALIESGSAGGDRPLILSVCHSTSCV